MLTGIRERVDAIPVFPVPHVDLNTEEGLNNPSTSDTESVDDDERVNDAHLQSCSFRRTDRFRLITMKAVKNTLRNTSKESSANAERIEEASQKVEN